MIRCVVFDFDGTLVRSNAIKRDGFFVVARQFAGRDDGMAQVLRDVNGDRHAVLRGFAELHPGLDVDGMVRAYTQWCEEQIVACPERAGASQALRHLRAAGLPLHLSSATPEDSLRAIVARRYAPKTFEGVHGGYARKPAVLRLLAQQAGSAAAVVCVGDGIDDFVAARCAGCHFIGVSGGTLEQAGARAPLVDDLRTLIHLVAAQKPVERV